MWFKIQDGQGSTLPWRQAAYAGNPTLKRFQQLFLLSRILLSSRYIFIYLVLLISVLEARENVFIRNGNRRPKCRRTSQNGHGGQYRRRKQTCRCSRSRKLFQYDSVTNVFRKHHGWLQVNLRRPRLFLKCLSIGYTTSAVQLARNYDDKQLPLSAETHTN